VKKRTKKLGKERKELISQIKKIESKSEKGFLAKMKMLLFSLRLQREEGLCMFLRLTTRRDLSSTILEF